MTLAYSGTDEDLVESYHRVHGNGEQTHVHIISTAGRFTVVALDVDPREFAPVASEAVGYEPTKESAQERAQAWMEQNPKGVAGSGNSGSVLSTIWHYLSKLDQSQTEDTNA